LRASRRLTYVQNVQHLETFPLGYLHILQAEPTDYRYHMHGDWFEGKSEEKNGKQEADYHNGDIDVWPNVSEVGGRPEPYEVAFPGSLWNVGSQAWPTHVLGLAFRMPP
jgi:hypothetical protein